MPSEPESSLAELGKGWLGSVDSVTFDEITNVRHGDRGTAEPIRRARLGGGRKRSGWLYAGAAALLLVLVGALAQVTSGNESPAPASAPTASPTTTPTTVPATTALPKATIVGAELSAEAAAVTKELATLQLSSAVAYSLEQQWTISVAAHRIEDQCLTDRGFDYTTEVPGLRYEIDEALRFLKRTRFDDRDELERYGYSKMQSQTKDYDEIVGGQDDVPYSAGLESALQECAALAAEQINPGAGGVMTHFPNDLDAAQQALGDRVRSETSDLLVEWTACMINGGFGDAENIPVMNSSAPSELNGRTEADWAVADYDCREATGITAERLRIRQEAITAYITDNQEELVRLSELRTQETERAAGILDS